MRLAGEPFISISSAFGVVFMTRRACGATARVRLGDVPRPAPESFSGLPLIERGGELPPRADPQLAVDAREVDLDRLHGDEERLGDLLVALVLRSELGDAPLARRQGIDAADGVLARPRAGGGELLVRPLDERGGADAVGELGALAQPLARLRTV